MRGGLSHRQRGRLFFGPDGVVTAQYKHGDSAALGRYGWYPTKEMLTGAGAKWTIQYMYYIEHWNTWFEPAHIYPHNILPMLKKLNLRYSLKSELTNGATDITTLLLQNMKYPFMNTLGKMGMSNLANDVLYKSHNLERYQSRGKLHGCINLPKEYMAFAVKKNIDCATLNWLTGLSVLPTEREFNWLSRNREDTDMLEKLRKYATYYQIRRYLERGMGKEAKKENRWSYKRDVRDRGKLWLDYLEMAQELGYSVKSKKVIYPKDLKKAHNSVMELIQVKNDELADIRIQNMFEPLYDKYFFEQDGLFIRPPKSFQEFFDEGEALTHCVCKNKFYEKHIKGDRLIFFIRNSKKLDKPYYTVEYDRVSKSILQCHGDKHSGKTIEVSAFLTSWQNNIGKAGLGRLAA